MQILCIANWSCGRDETCSQKIRQALRSHGALVHFDGADYDHNRIVTAFSSSAEKVRETLFSISDVAFECIDMREHKGVHPRIGALDVCPFVILNDSMSESDANRFVCEIAEELSTKYELPIFLYEKSETGKHAQDLPSLRKGEYEGLFGRELNPDFGPIHANEKLGATVMGLRDWLIAFNINLRDYDSEIAKKIARKIRHIREKEGRFPGVRALGFPLPSRDLIQVSVNITQPDIVTVDDIFNWVEQEAWMLSVKVQSTELIGVIRASDLAGATSVFASKEQIIEVK